MSGSSAGSAFAQVPLIAELSVVCALVVSGQLSLQLQDKPFFSVSKVAQIWSTSHVDEVTSTDPRTGTKQI